MPLVHTLDNAGESVQGSINTMEPDLAGSAECTDGLLKGSKGIMNGPLSMDRFYLDPGESEA